MEFITKNKALTIGAVFLVLVLLYWFFFKKSDPVTPQLENPEPQPQKQQEFPILMFHMGGHGKILRVDIYRDGSYRCFEDDNITDEGIVSADDFESIRLIVQNKDEMKDSYCEKEAEESEVGYGLTVLNRRIDLGSFKPECIGELYDHIAVMHKLLKTK